MVYKILLNNEMKQYTSFFINIVQDILHTVFGGTNLQIKCEWEST